MFNDVDAEAQFDILNRASILSMYPVWLIGMVLVVLTMLRLRKVLGGLRYSIRNCLLR